MTDLADRLFDSFQKEVKITSVHNEIESKDDELKTKESSNLLYDAFCSNCHTKIYI